MAILALGALAGGLGAIGRAQAHGVFPEVERVALHPADARVLAVQTSFGLAVTRDAGATWGWVCREAFGALETEDPPLVVTRDGALLTPLFVGLRRGERMGCGWAAPAGPVGEAVVIDVDRDPSGPDSYLAVTSAGGRPNAVHRTTDGGLTWAPTGPSLGAVLFESIRVAPSDARVVYLAGATVGPSREVRVFRSEDGGAGFRAWPVSLPSGTRNVRLLAVHPSVPMRLFAAAVGDVPRLLVSEDGGETFSVLDVGAPVGGVAFLEDGTAFAAAAAPIGLLRSDDGGRSFAPVGSVRDARCVAARGDALLVCANPFLDGFALGESGDRAATFRPILQLSQIDRALTCGPDDTTVRACMPLEPALRAITQVPASPSGCAVGGDRVGAARSSAVGWAWLLAVGAGLARWSRGRSSRRSRRRPAWGRDDGRAVWEGRRR